MVSRRRNRAVGLEVVRLHLLDVGQDVLVGDHHALRRTRRAGGVLQDGVLGPGRGRRVEIGRRVEVEAVDLDQRRSLAGQRTGAADDVVDDRGGRQQNGGSAVLQGRARALVVGTELRNGQRHRNQPGLQRCVERNDIVQALVREDGGAVPRSADPRNLGGQRLHAAVELRPRKRLPVAGRVDVVIDVRVSRSIRLLLCPFPQHCGNGSFGYCHRDTTP